MRTDSDVYGVHRAVRRMAADLGFGRVRQAELMIVASELATNILKYGRGGEIRISVLYEASGRHGVEIAASDRGPPIRNFEATLRDGWTDDGPIHPDTLLRRRGIGAGLGAVARLSDRLLHEPEDGGKTIIAQCFRRRRSLLPPAR